MKTLRITKENRAQYENTEINFDGRIEIEKGLGWIKFLSLKATLSIIAEAGCGIEASYGIKAGEGIKAGWGIKAGEGIEAGWGIKAGEGIKAKWLSVKLRIFAGLISWRLPKPEEQEIRADIRSGIVAYGNVVQNQIDFTKTHENRKAVQNDQSTD